ncbi:hypothetical protein LQW54_001828 [Pestalotiopsis sp. IQ-011]
MGIFLDAHALEQLNGEHKPLLDTIHGLRNHGVGQLIDLPHIILVGDQSSGKSSVLESILRVRFSFEDELCTRFATELILRTGPELNFNVQIQPAESANEDPQSFNETCSNNDDLRDIIDGAKRAMLQDGAGFSENILRIELFGPDLPNLVIVDLPGCLPSEDNNQSAGDRTVVDRLIESYMAKKTSIILAVVSAQTQLVLQKVLWKVKLHDKENVRTLGIVTKPDTVKSSRDEKTFVSLAQNLDKSHSLSLGWHVLRNRAEDEFDTMDDERDDQEEKFFQSGSWSSVPQENRGIDALRRRLSDILYNHIKTNLPRLVEDIENKISERQARLTLLGEPRSSPREIRSYLGRIASQFQIVSLQAVDGNYLHDFFGGLYPDTAGMTQKEGRIRKLRTLVGVFNRAFAYVLATKGSTHIILPKGMSAESDASRQQESRSPGLPLNLDDLVDLYQFEDPQRITFDQASELLEMESANHGTEFLAQAFVEELLGHLTSADDQTRSAILRDVVDPFFEAKKSAVEDKIKELLHHYQHGRPQPLGLEFEMMLTSRHQTSMDGQVFQGSVAGQPHTITGGLQESLRKKTDPVFRGRFDAKGLVDKAEAYYEASLRTFTENVIILGIENCLLEDLPNVFTTDRVNRMDDNELEQLAAESGATWAERSTLQEECESLKKSLQFCNKYYRRQLPLFTELEFPSSRLATARIESQAMLPDRLLQEVEKLQIHASLTSVDKQTQTLPTSQSMRDDTKPAPKGGIFPGTFHAHSAAPSGRDASVQTSGGQVSVAPSAVGTTNTLPVSGGLFGTPAQTGRPLFGGSAPTRPASGDSFGGSAPTGRPLFGGSAPTQAVSGGVFPVPAPTQPVSSGFMGRGTTNVPDSTKDGATFNPYSGPGLFGGSSYPAANRPVASPFNVDPFTSTITNGAKPLTNWRGQKSFDK